MTRVKELRELRYLTQSEMAEEVGITKDALSNIERGRHNVTLQNLHKIAKTYKVSFLWLLGFSEDKPQTVIKRVGNRELMAQIERLEKELDSCKYASELYNRGGTAKWSKE